MMNLQDSPEQQKIKADKEIARRILAKREFLRFITYINPWFTVSWHHEVVADALQKVEAGELKRLMIFEPPRHSKSEMVSVNFPPWVLGRDKNKNIIQASYADGLASEFGRQARNIVDAAEYKNIFTTTLAEDSKSKSTWSTDGRGKYNAVGIGGGVTGKGADIFIIDDPVKNRADADSEIVQESVYSWYKSTARTRLSPNGAIVVVMTRWNDYDLAGKILDNAGQIGPNGEILPGLWTVISMPAIAEEDEEHRLAGEALWPSKFDLANLLATKADIGSYEWAALYQQSPINSDTQEFTDEMFQYKTQEEVDALENTRKFITIDPAVKEKDTADFTGTCINVVDDNANWYVKSSGIRMNSKKLIDHIFDLWEKEKPEAIGIEETTYLDAIYPFMQDKMIEKNIFPIIFPLKHHGVNKHLRIRGLIPRYENKKVWHIIGKTKTLEAQQLRFPKAKNDDELDAEAYQDQIVVVPAKLLSSYDQARNDMQVDDRTGYFR